MEEAALINDLIYRIELVSHCPVDRLRSQCLGIERLNAMTNNLYQTVRSDEQNGDAANSALTAQLPKSPRPNPSDGRIRRSRHVSANAVLTTADTSAISLCNLLEQESNLLTSLLLPEACDWRLVHLQPIFLLQRTGSSLKSQAEDRIFLLCSCLSLAMEFQTYENSLGQTSRHDASMRRIVSGEDVAIQQNGKHFQGFLTTLKHQSVHKGKFDAGLRLGIKLSLIEAVGLELGIGSGLSLITGYECNKLARMPYREITRLSVLLKDDQSGTFSTIRACCAELGEQWSNFHREYHLGHSAGALKPSTEATDIAGGSVGSSQPAKDRSGASQQHCITSTHFLEDSTTMESSAGNPNVSNTTRQDNSWLTNDILSSFRGDLGENVADGYMALDLLDFGDLPSDLDLQMIS